MEFEEEFPSLIGMGEEIWSDRYLDDEGEETNLLHFSHFEVEYNCLDKQKVLDTIDEWILRHTKLLMRNDFSDLIDELKKELRL